MIIVVLVVVFWIGLAGYIILSLDGVLMQQETIIHYFHNFPFSKMPVTNGFLLGLLTVAAICFSLAIIPSKTLDKVIERQHRAGNCHSHQARQQGIQTGSPSDQPTGYDE